MPQVPRRVPSHRDGPSPAPYSGTTARISIYVQPRAQRSEIAGRYGDCLRVRIAAPPTDNAANDALLEFIARTLQVPRRAVRLLSGVRGRRKTLEIRGVDAARIARLLGSS